MATSTERRTWPGWRRFLRGTAAIWRTGGGLALTAADLWAGIRWWLRGA